MKKVFKGIFIKDFQGPHLWQSKAYSSRNDSEPIRRVFDDIKLISNRNYSP